MKKILILCFFSFLSNNLYAAAFGNANEIVYAKCSGGTFTKGGYTKGVWRSSGGGCNGKPDVPYSGSGNYYCYTNLSTCSCPEGYELGSASGAGGQTLRGCVPKPCEPPKKLNIVIDGGTPKASCILDEPVPVPTQCTAQEYYDPLLKACASLVSDASECGDQDFALDTGSGFACYQEQPDNTNCKVNIGVGGGEFTSNYICTDSSGEGEGSVSSASSASNTSSPSSSGANNSSASNTSSTPSFTLQECESVFGAGNCAPLSGYPSCPNTVKKNGVSYCVTIPDSNSSSGSNSSNASNTSNGSASSGASNSSSGSATSSGSNTSTPSEGECDPSDADYLKCVTPEGDPMPDHTTTGSGLNSVEDINADFHQRLKNSQISSSLNKFKNIVSLSGASCPDFSFELLGKTIGTTIHCSLWATIAVVLSPIMLAIWSIIAFRIFASA